MDRVRQYLYYCLVGVISVIMLIFMPMLGSAAGLQWTLPTTTAGWIVYVVCKLCSAGFNIGLFHCFNKQGKLNIEKNENYLEAKRILKQNDARDVKKARSPHEYHKDIYGKKGLTIFIMTLLGTVGLSQAVLTFDGKEFIVQLVALVIGIIMGILQMKDTESFWTEEFLEYAKDYAQAVQDKKTSLEQRETSKVYKITCTEENLVESREIKGETTDNVYN